MYTLLGWINPVVHLAGLVVAVWAYSVSRKRGYILIALYFLLAVISLTVIPAINGARRRHWQAEHSVQTQADEAYFREMRLLDQKYPHIHAPMVANIPIPLGAAILVVGLWVLASEMRKKADKPNADTTPHRLS